jgi:hypothetical protein
LCVLFQVSVTCSPRNLLAKAKTTTKVRRYRKYRKYESTKVRKYERRYLGVTKKRDWL